MMNRRTVNRDGQESERRPLQRPTFSAQSREGASTPSQPGILIFSYGQKLLHISRRAMEFTGRLDPAEFGPDDEIPLAPVQKFRVMIQKTLDERTQAGLWGSFESDGTVFDVARKLMIRGFGIANQHSHDHSRIVIVLDEVNHQRAGRTRQAPDVSSNIRSSVP